MSAKVNFTKEADGTIVYKTVSKSGSAPANFDSSKWYMDKCKIAGYGGEHLKIKINQDGIIRVDGDYNDGKASRSFFNEYIIPDGVNYEALEFCIYEADQNTLVILGAIGSQGGEMVQTTAGQVVAQPQQQAVNKTETSTIIKRTENVRISSTFTETFESSELEGSEDMSKEVRVVDNKFEAKVNVSEYKNEEVHVKISKKVVLIYTSRKEVTKTSTRREIKKTFEIPAGVKPESITSVVGEDGNLRIAAPVDEELARQQRQVQQTVQQTNTNEVLIRIRKVNTTKTVTGQDLKEVKINNDRFEMNVDVREYKLEEVTVKIIKTRRVITITADHKSQFESMSTFREFSLPAGTPDSNPDAIDVVLNANGILTITGPCTPQTLPPALTDITDDITKGVVKQNQQNTSVQQNQQNTSVQQTQQNTSVQQIQQNTSVQQEQQNTSVQRQQQNTTVQQKQQNTSVQQLEDTSVQQHQSTQQIIQKSRYTKITRETFSSSTMTSLEITDADGDVEEPLVSEPDTPIEDVTPDMGEDEDGNLIIELDVKDYLAEDIMVKASKTTITIIGRKNEDIKDERKIRPFCKKIQVPADVVVTPDTIRSIFDKPKGVLIIIVVRKKTTTTTTTKQISDKTTEEQNYEQLQQQKQVQNKQETVQETQTKIQTQQQINQQKQDQRNQESVTKQITDDTTEEQNYEQKRIESLQQRNQVQKNRETVQETQNTVQTQQQINQQRQDQQKQQSIQTTTSKRTIKTTTTTVESLQKLGYNFESATSQLYTGDPKFFERATPIIDYKPEELEVKIAMPWIVIEGKQEMTAENGWRSKQFTKMFTVPEGVKQENIKLELNDAGDVVNCTALIG